jgi:hypothetical protein
MGDIIDLVTRRDARDAATNPNATAPATPADPLDGMLAAVSRALKTNTLDSDARWHLVGIIMRLLGEGDLEGKAMLSDRATSRAAVACSAKFQADSLCCAKPRRAAFFSSAAASDSNHEAWLTIKMRSASAEMVLAIRRISAAAVRFASIKSA